MVRLKITATKKQLQLPIVKTSAGITKYLCKEDAANFAIGVSLVCQANSENVLYALQYAYSFIDKVKCKGHTKIIYEKASRMGIQMMDILKNFDYFLVPTDM